MGNLFQPAGQIKSCQEGRGPSFVLISWIVASGMTFPETVQSGESIGIKPKLHNIFNTLGTRLGPYTWSQNSFPGRIAYNYGSRPRAGSEHRAGRGLPIPDPGCHFDRIWPYIFSPRRPQYPLIIRIVLHLQASIVIIEIHLRQDIAINPIVHLKGAVRNQVIPYRRYVISRSWSLATTLR